MKCEERERFEWIAVDRGFGQNANRPEFIAAISSLVKHVTTCPKCKGEKE